MIKHYLKGRCWDAKSYQPSCTRMRRLRSSGPFKIPKLVADLAPRLWAKDQDFLNSIMSTELLVWPLARMCVRYYKNGIVSGVRSWSTQGSLTYWRLTLGLFMMPFESQLLVLTETPQREGNYHHHSAKGEMKPSDMPMSDLADVLYHEILGHKQIVSLKHYNKHTTRAFHFL